MRRNCSVTWSSPPAPPARSPALSGPWSAAASPRRSEPAQRLLGREPVGDRYELAEAGPLQFALVLEAQGELQTAGLGQLVAVADRLPARGSAEQVPLLRGQSAADHGPLDAGLLAGGDGGEDQVTEQLLLDVAVLGLVVEGGEDHGPVADGETDQQRPGLPAAGREPVLALQVRGHLAAGEGGGTPVGFLEAERDRRAQPLPQARVDDVGGDLLHFAPADLGLIDHFGKGDGQADRTASRRRRACRPRRRNGGDSGSTGRRCSGRAANTAVFAPHAGADPPHDPSLRHRRAGHEDHVVLVELIGLQEVAKRDLRVLVALPQGPEQGPHVVPVLESGGLVTARRSDVRPAGSDAT